MEVEFESLDWLEDEGGAEQTSATAEAQKFGTRRDNIMLLIDARENMLVKSESGECHFDSMVHLAEEIIKSKIFTDDQARVGVALLGTKVASNDVGAEGVFVAVPLDRVGVESIRRLERLREAGGMAEPGRLPASAPLPLASGLWASSASFAGLPGGPTANLRRVWVLSNSDTPCCGDAAEEARLRTRVQDSKQSGEQIALWALHHAGAEPFDPTKAWNDIVSNLDDGDNDDDDDDGGGDGEEEGGAAAAGSILEGAGAGRGSTAHAPGSASWRDAGSVAGSSIAPPPTVSSSVGAGGRRAAAGSSQRSYGTMEPRDTGSSTADAASQASGLTTGPTAATVAATANAAAAASAGGPGGWDAGEQEEEEAEGLLVSRPSICVYDDRHAADMAMLESTQRAHQKRTYARLPMRLPGGATLGVCLFLSTVQTKIPTARKAEGRTNRLLKAVTSWVCAETGQTLRRHDIHLRMPVGPGGETVPLDTGDLAKLRSMPAKLSTEDAALAVAAAAGRAAPGATLAASAGAAETMDDAPSLSVLSAAPASALRPWMLTRGAIFVFPSESIVTGSVGAFAALHAELVRSRRILLARLVARAGSAPRLVALVPQAARPNVVLASAGLLAVELAYADDLRTPSLGCEPTKPPPEAVAAAAAAARAVSLKDFSPVEFGSPALSRFLAMARDIALGDSAVDADQLGYDSVQPDEQMGELERFAAPLRALAALCGVAEPEDSDKRAKKRPAAAAAAAGDGDDGGGAGGAAKRAKRAADAAASPDAAAAVDWAATIRDGKLGKHTVPALKAQLKRLNLSTAGKRANLVARLEDHYL
ncbi:hypothetical protein FNF31_05482 [Cafeteria roenbergensis]|uniref:SAP domain-containing protein n=1 Tax=Cafeteria roenbergensis TaxID=33653 RepID=A0A5A8CZK0_CAFRO|nr:hypothetical protein FNF31_05482 [Cafeteria roenbergensis]